MSAFAALLPAQILLIEIAVLSHSDQGIRIKLLYGYSKRVQKPDCNIFPFFEQRQKKMLCSRALRPETVCLSVGFLHHLAGPWRIIPLFLNGNGHIRHNQLLNHLYYLGLLRPVFLQDLGSHSCIFFQKSHKDMLCAYIACTHSGRCFLCQ